MYNWNKEHLSGQQGSKPLMDSLNKSQRCWSYMFPTVDVAKLELLLSFFLDLVFSNIVLLLTVSYMFGALEFSIIFDC